MNPDQTPQPQSPITEPPAAEQAPAASVIQPNPVISPSHSSGKGKMVAIILVSTAALAGLLYGAYTLGRNSVKPTTSASSASETPTDNEDDLATNETKSRDMERETDIKAMHGQVEAYYAQNGTYPSLAQFNSATFRGENMKGLDLQALQDPQGTDKTLVATPTEHKYAYEALPVGCDNVKIDCVKYTLTATLENTKNGVKTYSKLSLN